MISDRYELEDLLGRGAMAEVRRAVDTRLGRPVAIKQLRADLATDPTFQARIRREAQSAAGLNHPNIVAVYDTGEETDPRRNDRSLVQPDPATLRLGYLSPIDYEALHMSAETAT